jgi:cytidylate kinase
MEEVIMAVITISRQFGAGGRTFGNMLSKELGYKFLDDVLIYEISKEAKVSSKCVKSLEREAGSRLSKIMSGLVARDYIKRVIGEKGFIDEEIYGQILREVMIKFAQEGNVILLGRGGQYILKDYEDTFHIFLMADMPHRIEFIHQYYNMTDVEAEQVVLTGEKKRANFFKKFGKDDYDQPYHYDLVLNMSRLSLEDAVKQVCILVQK